MSPELFKNKPYNHKSDVWALGCVLYEIATVGKHAFDAQSINGLAQKILKGAFLPIPPTYSKGLRDLITSMLNVLPNKRPSIIQIIKMPLMQKALKRFIATVLTHRENYKPAVVQNLITQVQKLNLGELIQEVQASLQKPTPVVTPAGSQQSSNASLPQLAVQKLSNNSASHDSVSPPVTGRHQPAARTPALVSALRAQRSKEQQKRLEELAAEEEQRKALEVKLKKLQEEHAQKLRQVQGRQPPPATGIKAIATPGGASPHVNGARPTNQASNAAVQQHQQQLSQQAALAARKQAELADKRKSMEQARVAQIQQKLREAEELKQQQAAAAAAAEQQRQQQQQLQNEQQQRSLARQRHEAAIAAKIAAEKAEIEHIKMQRLQIEQQMEQMRQQEKLLQANAHPILPHSTSNQQLAAHNISNHNKSNSSITHSHSNSSIHNLSDHSTHSTLDPSPMASPEDRKFTQPHSRLQIEYYNPSPSPPPHLHQNYNINPNNNQLSAKERVLQQKQQKKLQEELQRKTALESASKKYYNERKVAEIQENNLYKASHQRAGQLPALQTNSRSNSRSNSPEMQHRRLHSEYEPIGSNSQQHTPTVLPSQQMQSQHPPQAHQHQHSASSLPHSHSRDLAPPSGDDAYLQQDLMASVEQISMMETALMQMTSRIQFNKNKILMEQQLDRGASALGEDEDSETEQILHEVDDGYGSGEELATADDDTDKQGTNRYDDMYNTGIVPETFIEDIEERIQTLTLMIVDKVGKKKFKEAYKFLQYIHCETPEEYQDDLEDKLKEEKLRMILGSELISCWRAIDEIVFIELSNGAYG